MNAITPYGTQQELELFSQRIKTMVPGGNKLNSGESIALAQLTIITGLNPFIGELWYIPGSGPMIGIKGMRRFGNEQVKKDGGQDAYWSPVFRIVSPEEAGADKRRGTPACCVKCVIHDTGAVMKFAKTFTEMVNTLREAGDKDPVGTARELLGKAPEWIGYGVSYEGEPTKMGLVAVAYKRAEADALKRRFTIPFADVKVSEYDTVGEFKSENVIDATAQDVKKEEETLDEYAIVDAHGDWAVKYTADTLKCTNPNAAIKLWQLIPAKGKGAMMSKKDIKDVIAQFQQGEQQ